MIRVGIAVEGEGDLRVIRPMVDARLRLMMGWDENEPLDPVRQWVGAAGSKHDWLKVSEAPKRAREAGLPLNAREFGGATCEDQQLMRAVLLLFTQQLLDDPVHGLQAVVIARDTDGRLERCEGFKGALASSGSALKTRSIQAAPHPKREAWILLGFRVEDAREEQALQDQRRRLGFDPTREPHRLTAMSRGAKHDIKLVLHALTEGDHEREERCVRELLEQCPPDIGAPSEEVSFTDPHAFVGALDRVLRARPGLTSAPGA